MAIEAADAAAGELMSRFGRRAKDVRAKSGPTDLVSEADVAAEKAVRRLLAERRPGDAILGEEGGATGDGELRWVVDPLDGTINFLFGIPAFAVSVACEDGEGALAGVVLDPVRGERFTATRSGTACLDGEPIESSGRDDLARRSWPPALATTLGARPPGRGGRPDSAPRARHPPRRRGRA